MKRLGLLAALSVATAAVWLAAPSGTLSAQNRSGRIEGTVTADRGEVRA